VLTWTDFGGETDLDRSFNNERNAEVA